MYKVLIFDLWGTLADDDEEYSKIVEKEFGINGKEFMRKFWEFGRTTWQVDGEGEPTPYFPEICRVFNLEETRGKKVLGQMWKASLTDGYLYQWTIPLLNKLKTKFRIGLASNTGIDGGMFLEENPEFKNLLDIICLSYEIGVAKPDKKFFELIINKYGIKADECIFIDDVEKNVQKARESNLEGIVFQDYNQLKKELLNRGIKI